jgi:hypothetical protein
MLHLSKWGASTTNANKLFYHVKKCFINSK